MEKIKTALIGVGSVAQIIHLPILNKIEDAQMAALCDVDEAKVTKLMERYGIDHGYGQLDRMLQAEKVDALLICTTSHYHYPMTYLALKNGVHVFVEKPIALTAPDAKKLADLARAEKLTLMVGMQNRFRDDVIILKEFMDNAELGEIFYIKAGWLKKWSHLPMPSWQKKKEFSGGGVLIDMGSQLIDLALFLNNMPKIKAVRLYDYKLAENVEVEDAALAVIETVAGFTITIEVSWRMHLENDMIYTHIFGKKGAAYLNPLRINKELHGNLVNVTPLTGNMSSAERFKNAYRNELQHFFRVIRNEEENRSSAKDAWQVMRILDALYESGRSGRQVEIN